MHLNKKMYLTRIIVIVNVDSTKVKASELHMYISMYLTKFLVCHPTMLTLRRHYNVNKDPLM